MAIKQDHLYLKKGKQYTQLKTQNYHLNSDLKPRKEIQLFVEKYLELGPEKIFKLQERMTDIHCQHEMNFQVKDDSGRYSKVVATPFHGFAPIKKQIIDDLVKSTEPILQATRKLLQNLFKDKNYTAKSLGLDHLPKDQQETLLEVIKNNIYYEPQMSHPNFKDYPFLSIVGFDSAVSDLDQAQNIFFEFNAGTPCGIEDQFQLYKHLKNLAPELYSTINKKIAQDESHKLLKKTIDDCAKSWTKQADGISVVISPGTYNPAHPEIVNLAYFSGMPLVKMSDLYIDKEGFVRLKTIDKSDPKVTGIYNRKEESFLIYSQKHKIPLRSPFTEQNEELSRKFNVDLKPGILYSYQYDQNFNITGIDIDEKSQKPKYQTLFDSIGTDRENKCHGDIIEAIWNKKLYVNNLGGRVFDDKRAFRIIADHLTQNQDCAHPPKGISVEELESRFEEAVIKAPDLSGGAGVTICHQLNESEKQDLLTKVKKNPDYYEIQSLAKLAVIQSVQQVEGHYEFVPMPVDWRLIIFFGSDNKSYLSSQSCLVRTAPFGDLKTNTSSGGGYALGLIFDEKEYEEVENNVPRISYIGEQRKSDYELFFQNMQLLLENKFHGSIEDLTYQLRDIMDLIEPKNILWIQELRKYEKEEITLEELKESFEHFQKQINSLPFS